MKNLIKVDIQTGQVLEDNLQEFWDKLAQRAGAPETGYRNNYNLRQYTPALHYQSASKPTGPKTKAGQTLRERIKIFNTQRKRQNKNAWSEGELYRLVVLMGQQKRNHKQAALRLARTPGACHLMYSKLKDAGVI